MPENIPPPPVLAVDRSLVEALGRRLLDAEQQARSLAPLSDSHQLTVADAYAIQQEYARLRTAAGATLIGHKIGATAKAIQELFDIDTPDYGHLFDDMLVAETQPIPTGELIQPMTECEIAFVLDRDLAGPGISAQDVIDASAAVVPCLEIIDSRIHDWSIRLADTVADNGSSARFVVGPPVPIDGLDLAAEEVVLERNGEEVGRGAGRDVLGHPAAAAAWLANALGEFGERIVAGEYVLSGSMTAAAPSRPGDRFVARYTNLGTVGCSFSGTPEVAA